MNLAGEKLAWLQEVQNWDSAEKMENIFVVHVHHVQAQHDIFISRSHLLVPIVVFKRTFLVGPLTHWAMQKDYFSTDPS